jgi:hypothetical protein
VCAGLGTTPVILSVSNHLPVYKFYAKVPAGTGTLFVDSALYQAANFTFQSGTARMFLIAAFHRAEKRRDIFCQLRGNNSFRAVSSFPPVE